MTAPGPSALWDRASDEFPNDRDARVARYIDLMREHGHIVDIVAYALGTDDDHVEYLDDRPPA